jgi:molybdenum cofactor guanylyltransferase
MRAAKARHRRAASTRGKATRPTLNNPPPANPSRGRYGILPPHRQIDGFKHNRVMDVESPPMLVVLAGGRGSRLGMDKSRILIRGRPILIDLLDRIAWRGRTMLVRAARQGVLPGEGDFDEVATDEAEDQGPLAGVIAGVKRRPDTDRIVVAIDQVGIDARLIDVLCESVDGGSIACFRRDKDGRDDRSIEPLPMWISGRADRLILDHFERGGRAMRSLLTLPGATMLDAGDIDDRTWQNVNTPADLEAAGGVPGTDGSASAP